MVISRKESSFLQFYYFINHRINKVFHSVYLTGIKRRGSCKNQARTFRHSTKMQDRTANLECFHRTKMKELSMQWEIEKCITRIRLDRQRSLAEIKRNCINFLSAYWFGLDLIARIENASYISIPLLYLIPVLKE